MPGPDPNKLYALRCMRCGNPLELPMDPRLLYIDCPSCGQDNVLPEHLVKARQAQFRAQLAQQDKVRKAAAQVAVAKSRSKFKIALLLIGTLVALMTCGGLTVLGWWASREEEAAQRRADDPSLNGQSLMVARLEDMKQKMGCERILVQPEPHRGKPGGGATVSLDMVANDYCVHVLALTGTQEPISVRHQSEVALTRALPSASTNIDYRLCASKKASHKFFLNTTRDEPFTVAAIECPRKPEEGGSRAKADDPETNGKKRAQELLSWMSDSGCKKVVAPPEVRRGEQVFTLTLNHRAGCYNMFVASEFKDVRFEVELTDPDGKPLPVPRPAHEIRITHCAKKSGKYKLDVKPSTPDHYATVTVDCPRNGPEGLKRERAMIRSGS